MKAVILDMTVDKRWWLQCCLKSDTHAGMHAQAHTQTQRNKRKVKSQIGNNISVISINCTCFYFICMLKHRLLRVYAHPNTLARSHPHILVSSLISIITLEVLLCDFILFKAPQWHHGECVGHLTHAPHVSEYISNTAISSRPLKHHVPHGAVWVGGLNIYQWISSLKCHLAFNTKPILYFMFKCQFFTLMFCVASQWLLSVKRQQPLSQDMEVCFLKLLAFLTLS